MKRLIFIIILPPIFLSLISCSDSKEWVEMAISETGCMNPWDDYHTEKKDETEAVKAYLKDQDIFTKKVSFEQYSDGPFCMSCACPTGFMVVIQIHETDVEKALEIGFNLRGSEEQ